MPRKGPATTRQLVTDPVYGSPLVTQVINKVMLDGKKSIAEQIVYGALETVGTKTGRPPVEVLEAAVKKREDTHKMAEANKAFAHYRW